MVLPSTRSRLLPSPPMSNFQNCSWKWPLYDCVGDSHEEQLPVQPDVRCQFCGITSNHEGSEGRIWILVFYAGIKNWSPLFKYNILFCQAALKQVNFEYDLNSAAFDDTKDTASLEVLNSVCQEPAHNYCFNMAHFSQAWLEYESGAQRASASYICRRTTRNTGVRIEPVHAGLFQKKCNYESQVYDVTILFWQERAWKDGSFEGSSQSCFAGWKSTTHQKIVSIKCFHVGCRPRWSSYRWRR